MGKADSARASSFRPSLTQTGHRRQRLRRVPDIYSRGHLRKLGDHLGEITSDEAPSFVSHPNLLQPNLTVA